MKVLTCPICGKKNNFENKIKVSKKYSYIVCKACSGGLLYPLPKNKETRKRYESETYCSSLSSPIRNKLLGWFLRQRIYQIPSEWMISRFEPGKILDVGCGNGEFLYELSVNGWDVIGTDISNVACKNASKRIGNGKVKKGNFLKLNFRGKFDVISFWHVLEHLYEPRDYIRKARKLLSNGGRLVGEVPSFDTPLIKLFGASYAWIIVPEHLLYFSKKSLIKLFNENGFSSVELNSPPRALLNYSLSFYNNLLNRSVSPTISKMILILSAPFSVLAVILFAAFGRGEVMRFIAKK